MEVRRIEERDGERKERRREGCEVRLKRGKVAVR